MKLGATQPAAPGPENQDNQRKTNQPRGAFPWFFFLLLLLNQARKKSTKIKFLGPETARWGGGLLGFRREESGMSREFCRDVPDPWRCSKSLCKKNFVRIFRSLLKTSSSVRIDSVNIWCIVFFPVLKPLACGRQSRCLGWTYKLPGGQKFSIKLSALSVGFPQRRPLNLIERPQFIDSPGGRFINHPACSL